LSAEDEVILFPSSTITDGAPVKARKVGGN
jgi:hypothetical protein